MQYRQALVVNPNDAGAYQGLARVCRVMGRYDSLAAISRRLLAAAPEQAEFSLGLAEGLLGLKRTGDGIDEARRAARKWPEQLPALAELLARQNEPAEAIQFYRQVRQLSGDPFAHADRMIDLYERQGQYVPAVRELVALMNRSARAFDGNQQKLRAYAAKVGTRELLSELGSVTAPDVRARAQATVLLAAGKEAEAVRTVQPVLDAAGLDRFAREAEAGGYLSAALAVYQAEKRSADAGRVLRKLGRLADARAALASDNSLAGQLELGELELAQRNWDAADRAFSQALRLQPGNEAALFGRASCLVAQGKTEAARLEARKSGKPTDRLLLLVARTWFYEGKMDSASAAVAELAAKFPQSLLVNDGLELAVLAGSGEQAGALGRAMLDLAAGRTEQSLQAAAALARGSGPTAEQAAFVVAECQRQLGKPKDALAALDSFVARLPQSPLAAKARLEQARVYADDLKDESKGRETLQQLVLDYPGSAYAPVARSLLARSEHPADDIH